MTKGKQRTPNSSAAITQQAKGVLAAPANTETNPIAARSPTGKGISPASALPNVAPMKNKGVTSPPLKPVPMVTAVNRIFNANTSAEVALIKEA